MSGTPLQPGHLGFVVLASAALINAAVLYLAERGFGEVGRAAERAQHAQTVRVTLKDMLGGIAGAESLQGRYLITSDPAYRAAYGEAVAGARRQVEELGSLIRDNPVQLAQMETVRSTVRSRIQLTDEAIELREREGLAGAAARVRDGRGKLAMDALRFSLTMAICRCRPTTASRSIASFRRG